MPRRPFRFFSVLLLALALRGPQRIVYPSPTVAELGLI